MAVDQKLLEPWTREHDNPESPHIPQAPRIVYPKTLLELIEICREKRAAGVRLHAAGSHWALSDAAISDHTFIETHDPNDEHQALGRTLYDVLPDCMNHKLLASMALNQSPGFTLVHVEAGKRVYQLYAELDQVDDFSSPMTLAAHLRNHYQNPNYAGPWAFRTLGDSGGQTVWGALTTGTHGGDWREPPIADSVVALHLVADGGKHYWIEPQTNPTLEMQLVHDDRLKALYGAEAFGGRTNFEIIRDDDFFNAALMSAGRFGVVYSVVLLAVPQYTLHEDRTLVDWQDIKDEIKNVGGVALYNAPFTPPGFPPTTSFQQEFLQIAICLTPYKFCTRNLAGITRRWRIRPPLNAKGRAERVGQVVDDFDELIQAPRFAFAGNSRGYSPNPDPAKPESKAPSMFEMACADSSFLRGILKAAAEEIKNFVGSNGHIIGAGIPLVAGAGGSGLLALAPWLLAIAEFLDDILDHFDLDDRLGEQMERIKDLVLGDEDDLIPRAAAGIFVWQLIAYYVFKSQQEPRQFDAISYAVMETHDYLGHSCNVNVDSVEVFFNAEDTRLVAFVDELIEFEKQLECKSKVFLGYVSLRFVGKSRALLAPQRHPVTCAIEVACLKDMSGSQELVDYAINLARNPIFNAAFHWGQHNICTPAEIERIFGDGVGKDAGDLGKWRRALSRITDNGRLNGFSNRFTRQTGLEVVQPRIESFDATPKNAKIGQTVSVNWHCAANPPGTQITLWTQDPNGGISTIGGLPAIGQHQFQPEIAGTFHVFLSAKLFQREAYKNVMIGVS
jgi:hypothetical protein